MDLDVRQIMKGNRITRIVICLVASLVLLLFALEVFSSVRNFFPLRRWLDVDQNALRENYFMPTSKWGVIMFGDRYKPFREDYSGTKYLHDWRWNQSYRFEGDVDGKHRVDLDGENINFGIESFGVRAITHGDKSYPFYTDYYYISITYYRNLLLIAVVIIAFLRWRANRPNRKSVEQIAASDR